MTSPRPKIDMLPYWEAIVLPVVKSAARRYEGYTTQEDLGQEAAVWWYGPGQKYVETYLAEEGHQRLRAAIWRHIVTVAERDRAERVGYNPIDQVRYRAMDVAKMLPLALDPAGIPDGGGVPDDGTGIHAHGNLAEGGDVLATLLDVRRGLTVLSTADRWFLQLTERHRNDWDRVASDYNADTRLDADQHILPDTARRRHARIVERITRSINKDMEDAA